MIFLRMRGSSCGAGTGIRTPGGGDRTWMPMGSWFPRLSAIEAFAIDQTQTVEFGYPVAGRQVHFMKSQASELRSLGGTAGFLADEAPAHWLMCGVDALVLSVDNKME
jgi:hypothetical protein